MLGRWEQPNKFILINKWSKMGWPHFKICGGRKKQLQNRRRAGTQGSTVTEWSRKYFKWPSLHQFCNATLLNFPKGGVVSWAATSEDTKLCPLPVLLLLKLLACTGNIPFLTFRAAEGETAAQLGAQHEEDWQQMRMQESSSPLALLGIT